LSSAGDSFYFSLIKMQSQNEAAQALEMQEIDTTYSNV
jgi:hypothetical protein